MRKLLKSIIAAKRNDNMAVAIFKRAKLNF